MPAAVGSKIVYSNMCSILEEALTEVGVMVIEIRLEKVAVV